MGLNSIYEGLIDHFFCYNVSGGKKLSAAVWWFKNSSIIEMTLM